MIKDTSKHQINSMKPKFEFYKLQDDAKVDEKHQVEPELMVSKIH